MLTGEQRATTAAMWLTRWQGCEASGVSMAEYARREGFDADAAYRWKRILARDGQIAASKGRSTKTAKRCVAAKFARVALSDAVAPATILLRLVLRNGRRAELEIGAVGDLGDVLSALERCA